MSDTKHTPGPWTVIEGIPPRGGIDIGPDLEGVGPHAQVCFNGGESEANARLIAAAPDLLAALEEITDRFEATINPRAVEYTPSIMAAREAIAKAKGE